MFALGIKTKYLNIMPASKISVSTKVKVSPEIAWDYWTLAQHIVNWNFASDDWHCPFAENDLKHGGKFKATMAAKDGQMSFDFEGIYDKVVLHKEISYSLADGRRVNIVFKLHEGQTMITEAFDPEEINTIELQRIGWQNILDNFKKYVENN
jgi:uncharacterized protein YndB with AHSA1/START domain